ncbi:M56 family metallopeptidase [Novosphingobium sp.]|uniref:M56 family metallopeptidase n=1 Tax=Novosphingobium sp. TaxID=1874826 RepID=UPI0025F4CCDE|nr:M56 family metallopeptidase [Novosphingobium sp.]
MSWLVDTLVTTGALIAAVLILRRPVARHFGPSMAYALWLLPVLRLLLPPLTVTVPAPPAAEAIRFPAGSISQVAISADPAFDPRPLIAAFWLAGAAIFLAWRLTGYFLLRRRALRGATLIEQRGAVRVIETDAVPVPVAFGVIDKVVALPRAFAGSADAQVRNLAIAHELEHHAGRDIAVNFAMQPLLALHWFNPLAWAGWRALRRDQEAACDARVLAGSDSATREAYARLITAFARGPGLASTNPLACAVLSEKSIVYRLRSLTMTQPTPRRRLAGRVLIAAGVLALPLTASITYAAQDAPPAAPAAPMKIEKKMVIVEKEGPGKDENKLKTRVVTKDGKTIVFKTDKNLTDAEIDRKVEQAMADMPEPPAVPGGPGQHRIIIRRIGAEGMNHTMMHDGETTDLAGCAKGEPTQVNETSDADGKVHQIRIKICAADQARASAADAIRKARDEVARDKGIPDDVRAKVLKQLDEEIKRNAEKG